MGLKYLQVITIYLCLLVGASYSYIVYADTVKWASDLPSVAKNTNLWYQLIPELMKNKLYYGAFASAERMLTFFSDLKTKEIAYATIIDLIDKGYDYYDQNVFNLRDIETATTENFKNQYFFYKALINSKKGFKKWADYYFSKIDKENFNKYLFYQALQEYQNNNLKNAENLLKKILAKINSQDSISFVKKVSRTLARIYFEKKDYRKSLDIYESFLLKTNPITPSDWLEAAWNLFYLQDYGRALGMLYNMEAPSAKQNNINLEKFILRAIIYKRLCAIEEMKNLLQEYNQSLSYVVNRIMQGYPLNKLKILDLIELPQTIKYRDLVAKKNNLHKEYKQLSVLPAKLRALATFLYLSEIKMLVRKINMHQDEAYSYAANYIINLNESLKFLAFDIEREKFNPDIVFNKEKTYIGKIETLANNKFRIFWKQYKDFWLDERLSYVSNITNSCSK